jgi:hypothetical protein
MIMKPLTLMICVAGLVLSGCGNAPNSNKGLTKVKATLSSILNRNAAPAGPTAEEALAQTLQGTTGPVAVIALEAQGVATPFIQSANNGPVSTWVNSANQTVSTHNGLVVSTRGYGDDLMSSDNPELISLISEKRAGSDSRTMYFNDGSDRNVRIVAPCTVAISGTEDVQTLSGTVATTKIIEDCVSGQFVVQNAYWVSENGTTIQSLQWVSSGIGYMIFGQVRG